MFVNEPQRPWRLFIMQNKLNHWWWRCGNSSTSIFLQNLLTRETPESFRLQPFWRRSRVKQKEQKEPGIYTIRIKINQVMSLQESYWTWQSSSWAKRTFHSWLCRIRSSLHECWRDWGRILLAICPCSRFIRYTLLKLTQSHRLDI